MYTKFISRIHRPVLAVLITGLCVFTGASTLANANSYRPSGREGSRAGERVESRSSAPSVRANPAPRASATPRGPSVTRGGSYTPSAPVRPSAPAVGSKATVSRTPVVNRPATSTTPRPNYGVTSGSATNVRRPAENASQSVRKAPERPATPAVGYRPPATTPNVTPRPAVGANTGPTTGYRPPSTATRPADSTVRPAVGTNSGSTISYYPKPETGAAATKRPDDRVVSRPADSPRKSPAADFKPSTKSPDVSYRPDQQRSKQGPGTSYKPPVTNAPRYDDRPRVEQRRPEPIRLAPKAYRPDPVRPRYLPAPAPKSYRPPVYSRGYYYYPTAYYARPLNYAYWTFGFYSGFSVRSVYFHYGYFPYVSVTRVVDVGYPRVVYVDTPLYVRSTGYYLQDRSSQALDDTLADVRSAWIAGRFDLVQTHVRANQRVAVLMDGEYDYSIEADDYLRMTRDAIENMNTASFVWDWVRERSDGGVTAFASHVYYDSSGVERTVYVSYTLQKYGGQYYITEVGSSLTPLY